MIYFNWLIRFISHLIRFFWYIFVYSHLIRSRINCETTVVRTPVLVPLSWAEDKWRWGNLTRSIPKKLYPCATKSNIRTKVVADASAVHFSALALACGPRAASTCIRTPHPFHKEMHLREKISAPHHILCCARARFLASENTLLRSHQPQPWPCRRAYSRRSPSQLMDPAGPLGSAAKDASGVARNTLLCVSHGRN